MAISFSLVHQVNSKDTSFTGTSGTLAWELEEQGVENRNQSYLLRFLYKHSWLRIVHADDLRCTL